MSVVIKGCEHKEFMKSEFDIKWKCTECNLSLTDGEMLLYKKLIQLETFLKNKG